MKSLATKILGYKNCLLAGPAANKITSRRLFWKGCWIFDSGHYIQRVLLYINPGHLLLLENFGDHFSY